MNRIQLNQASHASVERLLRGQQGFAWWYADLVDAQGSGAVLIWSFGLPFLPGSRRASSPLARPAVCLALYRGGRSVFYCLNEHRGLDEPGGSGGSIRIGASQFTVQEFGDRVRLDTVLDEPVRGETLGVCGRFCLEGPSLGPLPRTEDLTHVWHPRTIHATGEIDVETADGRFRTGGSAYFDSNFSTVPLHEQAISRWLWGRVRLSSDRSGGRPPGRSLVFYEVVLDSGERELEVLLQDHDQVRTAASPTLSGEGWARGRYGLRAPRKLTVETAVEKVVVRLDDLVDDGPFYQRFLVSASTSLGEAGVGMVEVLEPSGIDVPWQRPFLNMRIQKVGEANSFWLPLFSGGSGARWRRLFRSGRQV